MNRSKIELILSDVIRVAFLAVLVFIIHQLLVGIVLSVLLFINTAIKISQHIGSILVHKSTPKIKVYRNGSEIEISPNEIMVNDIMVVSENDQVMADAIVFEGNLCVDESSINGDWLSSFKTVNDQIKSGSQIVKGSARVRVIKGSVASFDNAIKAKSRKIRKPHSEMTKLLNGLNIISLIIVVVLGVFLTTTFFLQKRFEYNQSDTFLTLASCLLLILPICLYLFVSISFFVSDAKLAKANVDIRNRTAIEALARIDTVCFDKTGTITDDQLVVKKVIPLKATYLEGNIAQAVSNIVCATGDTNSVAMALKKHFGLELSSGVVATLPFNCENKYTCATFTSGKTLAFGEPDILPIINKAGVLKRVEDFAKDGYRVIVLAEGKDTIANNKYSGTFEAVAIILLKEHIREDASSTFSLLKNNGVDIKVISGDEAKATSLIAVEAGIDAAHKYISLEGIPFDKIPSLVNEYTVFGNATAEQKEAIILALSQKGKKVAMVGNGVNDILAMKCSNAAITFEDGDDASKEVAKIIIKDNGFNKLNDIAKEGRRIVNYSQKVISFFTTKLILAAILIAAATFYSIINNDDSIQYPVIFKQLNQLQLFNIVVTGLAFIALLFDKDDQSIKEKLTSNVLKKIIPGTLLLLLGIASIFTLYWMQEAKALNFGIYTRESAYSISVIVYMVLSSVYLFKICSPFNKFRLVVTISTIALNFVSLLVSGIVTYARGTNESNLLGINFAEISGPAYLAMTIILIVLTSIYLFVYQIIAIKKGDNNNEN